MRNSYSFLKVRLFFRLVSRGKVSFRKLFNVCDCLFAYIVKRKRSGRAPNILSLELGNECNIACLFCRNESGVIHNLNSGKAEATIAKGKMALPTALDAIDQLKNDAFIAVLYTNGEPLLYHDLAKVIKHATDRKLATMIATNGLLLNDRIANEIMAAGIDLIKIQLSGFTNDIYRIQTRYGDVEKLKDNIRRIAKINKEGKYGTVILVDYILYKYNQHQLPLIRNLCDELGLMLNIRPGNPRGGLEDKENPLSRDPFPLPDSCAWVWQGMQVNWNGDILPCCEAVVWGEASAYEKFQLGSTRLEEVWNSPKAVAMRTALAEPGGRGTIDMCAKCLRKGICFKW